MRVLNEFDKSIATNLAKNVKAKSQLKVNNPLPPPFFPANPRRIDALTRTFGVGYTGTLEGLPPVRGGVDVPCAQRHAQARQCRAARCGQGQDRSVQDGRFVVQVAPSAFASHATFVLYFPSRSVHSVCACEMPCFPATSRGRGRSGNPMPSRDGRRIVSSEGDRRGEGRIGAPMRGGDVMQGRLRTFLELALWNAAAGGGARSARAAAQRMHRAFSPSFATRRPKIISKVQPVK